MGLNGALAVLAAALLTIAPVFGEVPARIRGTITAISGSSITVQERDGRTFTLKIGSYTTFANVVPSSLDAISVDDSVGTAVEGPLSAMVAVELALIPEDMRAGRVSFYKWDPLLDPVARQPRPTNMVNGSVIAKKDSASSLTLTVAYQGGSKRFQISVPRNAPIVRYELCDRSSVTIGSWVMIKTNPGDQASLVTVGKGVRPPM